MVRAEGWEQYSILRELEFELAERAGRVELNEAI